MKYSKKANEYKYYIKKNINLKDIFFESKENFFFINS